MTIDEQPATDSVEERPRDKSAAPWLDMIVEAQRVFQTYQEKCDSIDKLYANLEALAAVKSDREFQIFWANLEVLKPSIYARPPVPVVVPRFKDRKELPRKAADILERSLSSSFETEDIDSTMRLIRDDLAVIARGACWLRYETKGDGYECVRYEHVDRQDFLCEPARKWAEVGWVARRSWLSRKDGLARFGDEFLKAEFKERETDAEGRYKGEKKAPVWELWHKKEGLVVWVSPGMLDVLDMAEPFLTLDGFFPCPKPAFGTVQRGSLVPVPDFLYYRDQVEEINELTARISALAETLRMKGFYAGGSDDVSEAIESALKQTDNHAILIPVSNFAALGGMGLKDSIVWMPVVDIANTIKELVALRRQLIEDVYEITGLSDIMRGATDSQETATAQQLKSQYGSVRIRDRQAEIARIARDMARIAGEIMAENFQPQTLLSMSQVDDLPTQQAIEQQAQQLTMKAQQAAQSPQAQQMMQQNPQQAQQLMQQVQGQLAELQQTVTVEKVMQLLREQRLRPFVLDIETDSTVQPDEDAEKQRRGEFLQALAGAIQQLTPLVQMQPQAAEFAGEVLKFATAPFRAGRDLEASIDAFVDQMKQVAAQPQPNPEQQKAEAEAQALQQKMQADQAKAQMDLQVKQQAAQMDMASKQADLEMQQQEHAMKLEMMQAELAVAAQELQIKREEIGLKREEMVVSAQLKEREAQIGAEAMEHKADVSRRMMDDKAAAAKQAAADKAQAAKERD